MARDDLIQRRALKLCRRVRSRVRRRRCAQSVSPLYGGAWSTSRRFICGPGTYAYPVFPQATDIWNDRPNWQTGHWLTGRLGAAPLGALSARCLRMPASARRLRSGVRDGCDGYVVDRPMSPRAMIEPLAMAYAFDATAADGTLRFIQRGGAPVAEILEDDLVLPDSGTVARLTRAQETELPRAASFGFTDAVADYRRSAVTSRKLVGAAGRTLDSDLAVIPNDAAATRRAEIWLQDLWAGRENAEFALGITALRLAPGDVVALTLGERRRLFEIGDLIDTSMRQVKARSIDPEVFSLPLLAAHIKAPPIPAALGPVAVTVLDLPALDPSTPVVLTRLAIMANPWPGSVAIWTSSDGASFEVAAVAAAPCAIGETLDNLLPGPTARWDRASSVRVKLYGGALVSLKAPDKSGKFGDVILGMDNIKGYETPVPYFGAICGRYGNRIGKAQFVLDGKTYKLPANDGPNTLHGGVKVTEYVLILCANTSGHLDCARVNFGLLASGYLRLDRLLELVRFSERIIHLLAGRRLWFVKPVKWILGLRLHRAWRKNHDAQQPQRAKPGHGNSVHMKQAIFITRPARAR